MSPSADFDILVIGSGPAGIHAATKAVGSGLRTALLDIGYTDDEYERQIPRKSFSEIRRTDTNQHTYFLGKNPPVLFDKKRKAGTHLTPPRYHMIHNAESFFPVLSDNFFGLQSTSLGGLGVGWGANCFALEEFELKRVGLAETDLSTFYSEVAEEIGISGENGSDIASFTGRFEKSLPSLRIDSNSEKILQRYDRLRDECSRGGFFLGKSLLAVLSEPYDGRSANSYHDMDFWSDAGRSVYRPRYTMEKLRQKANFSYLPRRIALSFSELGKECTVVYCKNLVTQGHESLMAKRLILALGAINSARLALASATGFGHRLPILCSPNYWLAAINWHQLGKATRDERHSLAQLTAIMKTPEDYLVAQFYSYRSLLLFRLIHEMNLPPKLALLLLRVVSTSLTCINLNFSDSPSPHRWLELQKEGGLKIDTTFTTEEIKTRERQMRRFGRHLFALGCFPAKILRPTHGASIHYAGTLAFSSENRPLTCDEKCRLRGFSGVYVADASTWNYLSAKGPTLTLMAQARKVAEDVIADLRNA